MAFLIAASCNHFQSALIPQKLMQKQHIHIDGSKIIFQYSDAQSLFHQILRIFLQKGSLSGA